MLADRQKQTPLSSRVVLLTLGSLNATLSFATEKGGSWDLILLICWVWKSTRNGMFSSCLIFPFLAFGFMTWMCSSDYSS
ncbi:hypothetical protein NC651_008345 [Populus alba x Populus x berolinensis]|nr:hypothetical protein NC651_008345 [Populus alba x Populus x berolinensis]